MLVKRLAQELIREEEEEEEKKTFVAVESATICK